MGRNLRQPSLPTRLQLEIISDKRGCDLYSRLGATYKLSATVVHENLELALVEPQLV